MPTPKWRRSSARRGCSSARRSFYGAVGLGILLAFGGAVTGFILLGDSWYQLLIAAGLGLIFTQVAFLSHEAAHRQILASGPANDRLGRILANGIGGFSYAWWNAKHTRHHANPNRVGKDPDIEVDTIRFLEEDAAKASRLGALITRKQGWLFFPLLTLEGLNLHYLGVKHLVSRGEVKARWLELGLIVLRFALLLTPIFLFLPLGMAFAFLGVELAVFGVMMGAAFAPNHKGMPIIARRREARLLLEAGAHLAQHPRRLVGDTLMGGLNYQVEHHLFPSMPRPHLAKAREIVMEQCRARDVPYTETSLLAVLRHRHRVPQSRRPLGTRPVRLPLVARFRPS